MQDIDFSVTELIRKPIHTARRGGHQRAGVLSLLVRAEGCRIMAVHREYTNQTFT